MKIGIMGVDGFLGWPLAMHLVAWGHEVFGIDNFSRRARVKETGSHSATPIRTMEERIKAYYDTYGFEIGFYEGDLMHGDFVDLVIERERPDCIIHLGEIPSAPYSMIDRQHCNDTQINNIVGTNNLLFAMKKYVPDCHMVKLGTMGEYGTPNIDIPEGKFEIEYRGRKDVLPFPKQPGSFYHASKVADTINIQFANRIWGIRATDIHQGVVHGVVTEEMRYHEDCLDKQYQADLLTRFDFDECFIPGTEVVCSSEIKPIQDIQVEDEVLTHQGRFRRVLKTFERDYSGSLIQLKAQGRKAPITSTPNHPFLVVERKGYREYSEPRWMTATEIKQWFDEIKFYEDNVENWFKKAWELRTQFGLGSHRIAASLGIRPTLVESWIDHRHGFRKTIKQRDRLYFIYQTVETTENKHYIDCRDYNVWKPNKYNKDRTLRNPLPEKLGITYDLMKFFGFYLAEGSCTKYAVGLSLDPIKDKKHIQFVKDFSQENLKICAREGRPGVVCIDSKAVASLLVDLFGKLARGKRVPGWILTLPVEKQKGLIDGIFAGDGWNGNDLELVNKPLCKSVQLILGRMGLHASIYERTRDHLSLPEGRILEGTSTFFKCHHHSLMSKGHFKNVDGRILIPIRGTNEVPYQGKVYNLHVDEDNSYVADTVAVHNCWETFVALYRFTAQAVIGHKLTPYGKGGQTRGYIALRDSIQCMTIAAENPPEKGEYRTFNQFDECYSVNELADHVVEVYGEFGGNAEIWNIENPRMEAEEHYYNPDHSNLSDLGFKPTHSLDDELRITLPVLMKYRHRIEAKSNHIMPTVKWSK